MAEDTRVKQQKRKNAQKLNVPALLRVIGFAVLIVTVIIAIAFVIDGNGGSSGGQYTDRFEIGAASVSSLKPYSSGAAAVADSAVYYFDGSGNRLSKNEHTYSSPVAESNGKHLLLYDLGGNNLRIEKRGEIFKEHTFKSVLTCAAIGRMGNYAFSLNSDGGYQSHLYVYSGSGKKTFEWGSSSDYISGLSLSDNGNYCAATLLTSQNAKIISVVKLFDFSSDKPVFSVDFAGSVIYDIVFASSKQLLVFCDNGVYGVSYTGEKTEILGYTSTEIKHYSNFPSGMKAVSVAVYGNEKNTKATVLSKKGKILFEKSYGEEIINVVCSKNRVSVVLHDRIETYDGRGNPVGSVVLRETCTDAVISRNRLFILGARGLYSVPVNSVITEYERKTTENITENHTEKLTEDNSSDVSSGTEEPSATVSGVG